MKSLFITLLTTYPILTTSCVQNTPSAPPHELVNFEKKIIGTWASPAKTEPRGSFSSEKTFYPDGTAKGHGNVRLDNGGVSLYLPKISFTSRWKRHRDKLIIYDMKSETKGLFKPNEVHYDRIVKISDTEFSFIDYNTHELITQKRIR